MAETLSQHAVQMSTSYGLVYPSSKPQLPALNMAKVKTLTTPEEQTENLQQARDQWEAPQQALLSGRGGSTTRRLAPVQTPQHAAGSIQALPLHDSQQVVGLHQQGQQAMYAHQQPTVPRLNLHRQEGLGFGSAGGLDESVSARQVSSSKYQNVPAQRANLTARPSYSTSLTGQPSAASTNSQQQQLAATTTVGEEVSSSEAHAPWESGSITPAQALRRYNEFLSPFEQSEVLEYPQVYFVGRCIAQKVQANPHAVKANYGYDDERGDYTVVMHDHIAFRFEVLGVLGKGSFGQVLKCHDFKTGQLRALKVIRNKKRFHHQALVEVKILEHLRNQDPHDEHNVVHLEEYFYFRNHLCITFELLSVNLYEFVKNNNFGGLSLPLIRRFASQILASLQFMRQNHIIHCDLKPENILLRRSDKAHIKVIDFGSSCFEDERVYTYIQSRFYRSPEVILGMTYGCAIDMWSFGCIMVELFTGYPLFPGETEHDQLLCIMEMLGAPPKSLLETASRTKMFFDSKLEPRVVPNSRGKARTPGAKSLASSLKCTDAGFLDLLEKCFKWNPAERITPDMALQHVWIMDHSPSPTHRPMVRQKVEPSKLAASQSARKADDSAIGQAYNPSTAAVAQHDQAQRKDQSATEVPESVLRTASDTSYSRQVGSTMLSARAVLAAAAQQRSAHSMVHTSSSTAAAESASRAGAPLMPTPRTQLGELLQMQHEKLTPRAASMRDTAEPMPLSARWQDQSRPSPMQLDMAAQMTAVNHFLPQLGRAK